MFEEDGNAYGPVYEWKRYVDEAVDINRCSINRLAHARKVIENAQKSIDAEEAECAQKSEGAAMEKQPSLTEKQLSNIAKRETDPVIPLLNRAGGIGMIETFKTFF